MALELEAGAPSWADRVLWNAVQAGMAPFRPSPVEMYSEFDMDYFTYRYVLDFPSADLQFKFHMDRDEVLSGSGSLVKTSERVFQMLRYRESLPIPSNIDLGEN